MYSTSPSLLRRLRDPNQPEAWDRFIALYTPFLMHLLVNRLGVRHQDSSDIVQDIFMTLLRVLPDFDYDPGKGRFRGYLKQVCHTKLIDYLRKQQAQSVSDAELENVEDSGAARSFEYLWEADHNQYLLRQAMEIMQTEFQPTTWRACWETIVMGRTAADVGKELEISANAVFIARHRVLQRLREEFEGLLEEP